MGEYRHTPGKWKRSGCLVYALNDLNFNRFSARFDSARQPGEADAEECEANATLAASAPELLEALERVEQRARESGECPFCHQPPEVGCVPACQLTAARAAIKKARGEK